MRNSNINNFSQIFSAINYKGITGQPPLNSLSTWLYDTKKGPFVLDLYAKKYTSDPEKFIEIIKSLKKGGKQCK